MKVTLVRSIKTGIILTVFGVGLAGCTTAGAPTHRWDSTVAADEVQYRNDHATCQVQANIEGVQLDPNSVQFKAYKSCMNNRGYVLAAYRD
ncbi:MAG: hypothetical protein AAF513_19425 [Pseudomonadota bacterium]